MRMREVVWRGRHEPVLGTALDFRFIGRTTRSVKAAEVATIREIERLEQILSAFRTTSDLHRWRTREHITSDLVPELLDLLVLADHWQSASSGAFNPAVGEASRLWAEAEHSSTMPSADQIRQTVAAIAAPRFAVHDGRVTKLGNCETLTFHAIAKGFVVDRAVRFAIDNFSLSDVLINIGGDLAHFGSSTVRAGIEDQTTTSDNVPPSTTVTISNAALATSSGSRRGFNVGGEWFGHVIDPRTAKPVDAHQQVSVIAPDATTADVIATIVGVARPAVALETIEAMSASISPLACRIATRDGKVAQSTSWKNFEAEIRTQTNQKREH
jgi:FAD:protein FMN transferase